MLIEEENRVEKSLPFDKYKDKETMERKQRAKVTNMFNVR